eukprot:TRINITY_DN14955_c0_g2_i1.p1 TRINITY_DN14955_c0_g2~~TRINITY_DN14955_c0_g2_i1.p1  ORF type:complete len:541 (-),score=108.60 TRINITY_DN14955_c0_g2_i1:128-1750(-)
MNCNVGQMVAAALLLSLFIFSGDALPIIPKHVVFDIDAHGESTVLLQTEMRRSTPKVLLGRHPPTEGAATPAAVAATPTAAAAAAATEARVSGGAATASASGVAPVLANKAPAVATVTATTATSAPTVATATATAAAATKANLEAPAVQLQQQQQDQRQQKQDRKQGAKTADVPAEASTKIVPRMVHARGNTSASTTGDSANVDVHWFGVYALVALMFIAITPILLRDGILAFLIVLVYLTSLSLVKMFVKDAMNGGLRFPNTITTFHLAATAIVAFVAERPKLSTTEAFTVLPISLVTGISLSLNNTALAHGGVAFVSMIGCSTPAFTFVLELVKGKRELSLKGFLPVFVVCLGACLCVKGEATASILAAILAAAATGLRSLKSVWQHDLLTIDVPPMRLVFWTAFWSLLFSVPTIACSEGLEGFREFKLATNAARIDFLMSCLCACALNTTQVFAVKLLGALMQTILGNANIILVLALSAAWLHEEIHSMQYVGTVFLVIGALASKGGQFTSKSSQKATADEQLPTTERLVAGLPANR